MIKQTDVVYCGPKLNYSLPISRLSWTYQGRIQESRTQEFLHYKIRNLAQNRGYTPSTPPPP